MGVQSWLQRKVVQVALTRFLKGATMSSILSWLSGKKTYTVGLVGVITGILSLIGASVPGVPVLDKSAAVQLIVTSLLGVFIRNGIASVPK